jgi:hypothetical protein
MTPQEFIQAEEANLGVLDKFFNHHPQINSTSSLAASWPVDTGLPEEKVVHRSPIGKITAVLLALFMGWTAYVFARMMPDMKLPPVVSGMVLVFLVGIGLFVLGRNLFYPKYRFDIKLDKNRVQVGDDIVQWADVTDTYIMSKQEGKVKNNWLVLFKTDDTVQQFELFKFSVSMHKLAAYVEYYKNKK